jgi:hypothetical protein
MIFLSQLNPRRMHDASFNGQSWSRRQSRYAAPPIGLTKSYGVLLPLLRLLIKAGKPDIMHYLKPG